MVLYLSLLLLVAWWFGSLVALIVPGGLLFGFGFWVVGCVVWVWHWCLAFSLIVSGLGGGFVFCALCFCTYGSGV